MVFPFPTLKRNVSKLQARKPPHPNTLSLCIHYYSFLPIKTAQKNVDSDSCRSTIRGLRIAHHIRTTTRSPRRNVCIFIHLRETHICVSTRHATKHPCRTSNVAKFRIWLWKLRSFESSEQSVGKRLYMQYIRKPTLKKNRHNPLAWVHDTKVRIIF